MKFKKLPNGIRTYALNDELDEKYELDELTTDITFVVYWYEQGSYDGSGMLFGRYDNGDIAFKDLGHCSCYGPMDKGCERLEDFPKMTTEYKAKPFLRVKIEFDKIENEATNGK